MTADFISFILLVLGAYLLGSVPAAYLAAKLSRGIDLRQYGSGNVGASNVLRVTSKWIGILVIIFDIGKGMILVYLAKEMDMVVYQQVVVGLAVIIGHNWPVFLRFNGGRGILTALGVVFMLAPWLGLIALVIAFSLAPFHQLALGVIIAVAALPLLSWFLSSLLGIAEKLPITLGFLLLFLIVVARRLTAPRAAIAASIGRRQLFVNRLFFDRDIRDRGAWIDRSPAQAGSTEQSPEQRRKRRKG